MGVAHSHPLNNPQNPEFWVLGRPNAFMLKALIED